MRVRRGSCWLGKGEVELNRTVTVQDLIVVAGPLLTIIDRPLNRKCPLIALNWEGDRWDYQGSPSFIDAQLAMFNHMQVQAHDPRLNATWRKSI